jgi:hypothetical protein
MKTNFSKITGIAGNAGVGKDTLGRILQSKTPNSKCFSLAYSLRKEVEKTLNKFNLNVWTQNRQEKEIFRNFLVEYANLARNKTQGTYFWKKLHKNIKLASQIDCIDYAFITDVRYAEYEKDELWWVKNHGKLIHLSGFKENGLIINPANSKERENYKSLYDAADYRLEWVHSNNSKTDNEIYLDNQTQIDLIVNSITRHV